MAPDAVDGGIARNLYPILEIATISDDRGVCPQLLIKKISHRQLLMGYQYQYDHTIVVLAGIFT